jgi:hypothetical protein
VDAPVLEIGYVEGYRLIAVEQLDAIRVLDHGECVPDATKLRRHAPANLYVRSF